MHIIQHTAANAEFFRKRKIKMEENVAQSSIKTGSDMRKLTF